MDAVLLALSTWAEVEAYLKTSTGIILPIGSIEQHGPNGLMGTDAICAEAIAQRAGEAASAMVGPTIPVGMAVHHMEFPGSMTLRPSTLMAVLRDYVSALAEHGFDRFLFVNGHGGNVATLRAAFYEIYADQRARLGAAAPDLRCHFVNWWDNPGVGALSKELFGSAEGSHATPSEVSVTQCLYPEAIKAVGMEPHVAPAGSFYDARDFRRRYPDGRIGSAPSLARPEHGARLIDAAVQAVAVQYRSFLAQG